MAEMSAQESHNAQRTFERVGIEARPVIVIGKLVQSGHAERLNPKAIVSYSHQRRKMQDEFKTILASGTHLQAIANQSERRQNAYDAQEGLGHSYGRETPDNGTLQLYSSQPVQVIAV